MFIRSHCVAELSFNAQKVPAGFLVRNQTRLYLPQSLLQITIQNKLTSFQFLQVYIADKLRRSHLNM